MPSPTIEILGVHRLSVSNELVREQQSVLYSDDDPDAEAATREQLESTVLMEAVVRNRDSRFSVEEFTQPQQGVDRDNWQVPWAEAFLAPDGETLVVERWSDPPQTGDLRVAFYLHYWQSEAPLLTSYGSVACPTPTPMPERLARLVPYEPVD